MGKEIEAMPKFKHFQVDHTESGPGITKVGRISEGMPSVGKGKKSITNATVRKDPSEGVGADSLPGWVKKNITHFEATEGRL